VAPADPAEIAPRPGPALHLGARNKTLQLRFRHTMVGPGGGHGAQFAGVDPLLERGITDSQPGGSVSGLQGHETILYDANRTRYVFLSASMTLATEAGRSPRKRKVGCLSWPVGRLVGAPGFWKQFSSVNGESLAWWTSRRRTRFPGPTTRPRLAYG